MPSTTVNAIVDALIEQDFNQIDFGKPKQHWQKWLEQIVRPFDDDERGAWLRKKTLEQHGLDHGYLYHFIMPRTTHMPAQDVWVTFDTFSLDVIWTESSDPEEIVYFSKYDYDTLQDNFPEEYLVGSVKVLATLVIGEQDIYDEYENSADELKDDPLEFVPFTTQLVEI